MTGIVVMNPPKIEVGGNVEEFDKRYLPINGTAEDAKNLGGKSPDFYYSPDNEPFSARLYEGNDPGNVEYPTGECLVAWGGDGLNNKTRLYKTGSYGHFGSDEYGAHNGGYINGTWANRSFIGTLGNIRTRLYCRVDKLVTPEQARQGYFDSVEQLQYTNAEKTCVRAVVQFKHQLGLGKVPFAINQGDPRFDELTGGKWGVITRHTRDNIPQEEKRDGVR
ncbi:TPA: hypothetical protein RQL15_003699 [Vibrio vulnificus]|nr:hypothetical protein [Vibrio vulnificus]